MSRQANKQANAGLCNTAINELCNYRLLRRQAQSKYVAEKKLDDTVELITGDKGISAAFNKQYILSSGEKFAVCILRMLVQ